MFNNVKAEKDNGKWKMKKRFDPLQLGINIIFKV